MKKLLCAILSIFSMQLLPTATTELIRILNNTNGFIIDEKAFITILDDFVKQGADVNAHVQKPDREVSLLQLVVSNIDNAKSIIEFLVAHGADINEADYHGITPILYAFWKTKYENVQTLVKLGARVRVRDLFYIISSGRLRNRLEFVKMLIAHCENLQTRTRDESLLHTAARVSPNITRLLLESGLDPDITDASDGSSPIHVAVEALIHGYVQPNEAKEIVNELIKNGVSMNAEDNHGSTPLHRVLKYFITTFSSKEREKMSVPSVDTGPDNLKIFIEDELSEMSEQEKRDTLKEEFTNQELEGMSVEEKQYALKSLIGKRIYRPFIERGGLKALPDVFDYALSLGADPFKKDHEGISPIHLAHHANIKPLTEALIEAIKKHMPEKLELAQAELEEDLDEVKQNALEQFKRKSTLNTAFWYGKEAALSCFAVIGAHCLRQMAMKFKRA